MSDSSRREFLQLVASAASLPHSADFLWAWLGAARAHVHGQQPGWRPEEPPLLRDYSPKFFDSADFDALRAFTEILIPTDDTPGAREAHCAHFIDFLLQASPAAPQKRWRDAMHALKEAGFHEAAAPQRVALVEAISKPERDRSATHPAFFAYRLIKEQNTFAFYTSRAGMIETLDYKGNTFNAAFPACEHDAHKTI
jgi:glucoside 3-dehydrogenase (cytochrome c) hitch-hiker subunit